MATKVDKKAFDVLKVTKKMPMKKFLDSKKLKFEKGKSYYEMTKGEVVQGRKKESYLSGLKKPVFRKR
jgi:hypothetical protein